MLTRRPSAGLGLPAGNDPHLQHLRSGGGLLQALLVERDDRLGLFQSFASGQTPPADWMSQPALYTDLNSPVGGVYPILDPAAVGKVQGFSIASTAPASSTDAAPMRCSGSMC